MKKYIRTSNEQSKSWKDIVKSLQSDWNNGRNPFYIGTEEGHYVENMAIEIETNLGLGLIPSFSDGKGEIQVFYDGADGDMIGYLDYEDYCETLIEIASESKYMIYFDDKYEAYLKSVIQKLLG